MSRTDNRDIFTVTNGAGVERVSDTPNTQLEDAEDEQLFFMMA